MHSNELLDSKLGPSLRRDDERENKWVQASRLPAGGSCFGLLSP